MLDVDSTLCGIEGIDWLASLRDAGVAENVANATARAMRGESSLESVYADRLALVSPTRAELRQLAQAYRDSLSPGAREEIRKWREAGVHVVLVSGGLREAIAPVAAELGFLDPHEHELIVSRYPVYAFGMVALYRSLKNLHLV